ncbi:MAG: hypothetical protein ACO3PR_07395, partial [Limisphaerales bacterium]
MRLNHQIGVIGKLRARGLSMFNLADPVQKMIHVCRIKSRFSHTHSTGSRAMAVRASGHDEPM